MHAGESSNTVHAVSVASSSRSRPQIAALTSVRFFAALQVVLLHSVFDLGGNVVRSLPTALMALLTNGELAVSFFFVLSGFVMTYTYCDAENQLKTTSAKFWQARFARIYPLYVLGMLLDTPGVVAYFLGSAGSFLGALVKLGVSSFAYLTLLQSWHPRVTNIWNTPGWTLSVEAFFYALFPWLLWVSKGWSLRRVGRVALALWLLPLALERVAFYTQIVETTTDAALSFWRSFPPLRLPEFVLGIAAGRFFLSVRLEEYRITLRRLSVAALVLIIALAVGGRLLSPSPLASTVGAPLFAVAILGLASGALPSPAWLSGHSLCLLGRASYAVYILHQPFKPLFMKVARLLRFDTPSPALLVAYLLAVQVLCLCLSRWVEEPMRDLLAKPRPVRA